MALSPTIMGGRDFRLVWDQATLKAINKMGPKALGKIADRARDQIKARAPVDEGALKESVRSRMARKGVGSMVIMRFYGYFLHKPAEHIRIRNNFVDRGVAAMESEIDDILAGVW